VILNLDGHEIQSSADFHEAVLKASGIGFYGKNLSALWDVLTGLVERPVRITWSRSTLSEHAMGNDFHRIVEVIRKAETYLPNDDFYFEMSQ